MAVRFVSPQVQALDTLGVKAPGAKLRFYDAGTTDPRTVYSDDGLSIAYVQPIVADSAGVWPAIFLPTGVYKVTIHSSADVLLATYDDIDPSLSTNAGALAVASGGTGATTAAGARSNLGAYPQVSGDALDDRVADVEVLLDNPILAAAVTQTFAASFTPDFTADETRVVTLTAPMTLNAPTVTAGQKIRLILIQDGTGNRTWTTNAAYKFPYGRTPALSTSAGAIDVLEGYARTTGEIQVTSFKRQDATSTINAFTDYDKGALALSTVYTQAHGLARFPSHVAVWLECTTIDAGWAVGDRLLVANGGGASSAASAYAVGANTVNAYFVMGAGQFASNNKSTGASADMTTIRWKVIIRVYE